MELLSLMQLGAVEKCAGSVGTSFGSRYDGQTLIQSA